MLNIYPIVLETLRLSQPLARRIAKSDPDLARQLRRASSSIVLNLAEGQYSRGKNREARYHSALGSARETLACFEVALALGYIRELSPDIKTRFNRIIGTLVRLVR